jgi:hypothetical protein
LHQHANWGGSCLLRAPPSLRVEQAAGMALLVRVEQGAGMAVLVRVEHEIVRSASLSGEGGRACFEHRLR